MCTQTITYGLENDCRICMKHFKLTNHSSLNLSRQHFQTYIYSQATQHNITHTHTHPNQHTHTHTSTQTRQKKHTQTTTTSSHLTHTHIQTDSYTHAL